MAPINNLKQHGGVDMNELSDDSYFDPYLNQLRDRGVSNRSEIP